MHVPGDARPFRDSGDPLGLIDGQPGSEPPRAPPALRRAWSGARLPLLGPPRTGRARGSPAAGRAHRPPGPRRPAPGDPRAHGPRAAPPRAGPDRAALRAPPPPPPPP